MKKTAVQELRDSNMDQLLTRRAELRQNLAKTQQQLKLGKEPNLKASKNLRHQIAITNTIIRQKQLQSQNEE